MEQGLTIDFQLEPLGSTQIWCAILNVLLGLLNNKRITAISACCLQLTVSLFDQQTRIWQKTLCTHPQNPVDRNMAVIPATRDLPVHLSKSVCSSDLRPVHSRRHAVVDIVICIDNSTCVTMRDFAIHFDGLAKILTRPADHFIDSKGNTMKQFWKWASMHSAGTP
jgi:hypothetical protein